MANQLAVNPLSLDTAAAGVVLIKDRIKINNIEFLKYSVATDEAILTDQNGKNVWDSVGSTNFNVQRSGHIGWVNGLIFQSLTMGSTGIIKVYFE
jgi:hypothetical protein